jgi:hypothetical protein
MGRVLDEVADAVLTLAVASAKPKTRLLGWFKTELNHSLGTPRLTVPLVSKSPEFGGDVVIPKTSDQFPDQQYLGIEVDDALEISDQT